MSLIPYTVVLSLVAGFVGFLFTTRIVSEAFGLAGQFFVNLGQSLTDAAARYLACSWEKGTRSALQSLLSDSITLNRSILARLTSNLEKMSVYAGSRTKPEIQSESFKPRIIGLLSSFKWFCGKENREHILLIQADLRRDINLMRAEGRSRSFIRVVLWRHVLFGTILPILWDGLMRQLGKVGRAATLIKKLRF